MSRNMKSSGFVRDHRRWLVWLPAGFIWLFFGSGYVHVLLYLVHQAVPSLEPLLTAGYVILYPLDWLFTYVEVYAGLSVLGSLLGITAMVWGRPGWQGRIVLQGDCWPCWLCRRCIDINQQST